MPHYSPKLSRGQLRNQIVPIPCTGSHQMPALWSILKRTSFPSTSFRYEFEDIKPQSASFVNGFLPISGPSKESFLRGKKTFDFLTRTCYCMHNIEMRRRRRYDLWVFQRAGGCCDPVDCKSNCLSLLSRKTERLLSVSFSVCLR